MQKRGWLPVLLVSDSGNTEKDEDGAGKERGQTVKELEIAETGESSPG